MLTGESKKLRDWSNIVEKGRVDYFKSNGSVPDMISINQEYYFELCAAAGSLIKKVGEMKIMVRWGGGRV